VDRRGDTAVIVGGCLSLLGEHSGMVEIGEITPLGSALSRAPRGVGHRDGAFGPPVLRRKPALTLSQAVGYRLQSGDAG
jgi:hypothetical protein